MIISWRTADQVLLLRGVDGGHGGNHGIDTTLVANVRALADLVVPFLSPVFSPRVLDDPVWLILQAGWRKTRRPIANKKNTVVKAPATDVWA